MIVLAAAFMSACGDSETKKLVDRISSSYELDGQKVTLKGYVTIGGMEIVKDGAVRVSLVASPTQQSASAFATARVRFGQEPNCVWMPDKFKLDDVEIYDAAGAKYGTNTKFAFVGVVRYTNKDWEQKLDAAGKQDMFSDNEAFKKMREKSDKKNREAAEERRKKTGDANDYSFEFVVDEIIAE